jgi:SAM-dependent methyltransferase
MTVDEEFWNTRYAEHEHVWSGRPNAVLVEEVTGLVPGRALDLGCGEGADAIWLARNGWQVTATDVSSIALERAAKQAAIENVADRIDWQQRDLTSSFPPGEYDLVSAQFLHSNREAFPRTEILRAAAAAVAPAGVLLIVGHGGPPPWEPESDVRLPTPDEVLASLELPDGDWEVLRCDEYEREQNDPHGQPMTRIDNALTLRRRRA